MPKRFVGSLKLNLIIHLPCWRNPADPTANNDRVSSLAMESPLRRGLFAIALPNSDTLPAYAIAERGESVTSEFSAIINAN